MTGVVVYVNVTGAGEVKAFGERYPFRREELTRPEEFAETASIQQFRFARRGQHRFTLPFAGDGPERVGYNAALIRHLFGLLVLQALVFADELHAKVILSSRTVGDERYALPLNTWEVSR
jgi:hypothetical protein